MSTVLATVTVLYDDDSRPTRWEIIKDAVGYPLGGRIVIVAERIRMFGERVTGSRPRTDKEQSRANYDWGYRMGIQRRTTNSA